LIKKIFDIFYHSKPILSVRRAAAKRIDRRLAPLQAQQVSLFNQLSTDLDKFHKQLDERIVRAIEIGQFSDWRLKVIGERQESVAHINCVNSLSQDFERVMDLIFADEANYQPANNSLILIDLVRAYMYEGGIWQLRQEINDFLTNITYERPGPQPPRPRADRPLKILVISGLFPSIEHGGGLRLFDILRGLAVDHDIDLYTVYEADTDNHSLNMLKEHLRDIRLIKNEQIVDLAASRDDIGKWLRDIGKDKRYYDVIQLEYPHTIYLTNFMKRYGKKVGFTFMECQTKSNVIKIQEMTGNNDLSGMPRFSTALWKYAVAEKFVLQNADFLIAVTQEDADFLQRLYPRRVNIIPTCLSQTEIIDKAQESNTKAEAGRVAFLGYFGHYPNIDSMKWYLSRIHPIIKSQVPSYEFLIIGAGDTTPLQELAAHDKSVKFTGRVDNVMPYIQSASVCILPLITGAGIRGKLNQYSIAGRPSVSTTIGNKGLDYQPGISAVIADKAPDFAQAVIMLLNDEAKRKTIAAQALIHAKDNYTWDNHLKKLTEIYRDLPS
ncbi:MAG TPA: glycosyltransferase, partial [Desulfobacterales bacterium]|nr:glycosyltransferase [Desulfobacterales bacterium]